MCSDNMLISLDNNLYDNISVNVVFIKKVLHMNIYKSMNVLHIGITCLLVN